MDIEEQYEKIYRYCYFKVYDKQLAQDITQEAFLRFYKQDVRPAKEKELPYLYTIAKNLCIDSFRKKTTESLEALTEEATYDPTEAWTDDLVLRTIVARLPQEEQELIFLRYVNGIGVAAICKITGFSRFVVYRRLTKALKWLKEELKKEGFSE